MTGGDIGDPERRSAVRWAAVALAVLVPAAATATVILRYGLNFPYADEWELVPYLAAMRDGSLTLDLLQAQHNEHRMLFPRLVMLALAVVTGWDIRAELWTNHLLAFATVAVLLRMLWPNLVALPPRPHALVALLIAAAVFSLAQKGNWLWGWQVQWYLALFGIVLSVHALSRALDAAGPGRGVPRLGVAVAAVLLAQYSLASGVLLWPLGAVMILLHPRPGRWPVLAGWLAAGAVATAVYFHDWHPMFVPGVPGKLEMLGRPDLLLQFVLVSIGGLLGGSQLQKAFIGGLLVLLMAVGSLRLLTSAWDRRAEWLPWILLAAFVGISGFATALGRLPSIEPDGSVALLVGNGAASRYITISLLFTVAVIGLWTVVLTRLPNPVVTTRGMGGLAVAFAMAMVPANLSMLTGIKRHYDLTREGLACLLALDEKSAPCLARYMNHNPEIARLRVETLRDLDWVGFAGRE
ncbi:hypothetical protein HL658_02395 [Azospirillum sp. RWY-5-1]|uniref:Glycosyltransferase RgtA/B/C/D-like domain-containing protein n=1 Tax=Azospirillum oleiclasticum TaxID=2735135 RepID=A0ABX2T5H0_9PROT|nr:hypothetical protein [Azospirillum oleiclasticum]NYZ11386.1 hypothetical protein [Azospirillum oleiclasticum]NYZ18547.1 hypothetical protein [Azospirillum oleiclasticum]